MEEPLERFGFQGTELVISSCTLILLFPIYLQCSINGKFLELYEPRF